MTWSTTPIGSLKGAVGAGGAAGRSITSSAIQPDGTLLLTYSDATTENVGVVRGLNGRDGSSVRIVGDVATAADLLTTLTATDVGNSYLATDTGHLHVWTGTAFTDIGVIRGDQGPQGNTGAQGVRGTRWYPGTGAPVDGDPAYTDALAGDLYLDTSTGDIYAFGATATPPPAPTGYSIAISNITPTSVGITVTGHDPANTNPNESVLVTAVYPAGNDGPGGSFIPGAPASVLGGLTPGTAYALRIDQQGVYTNWQQVPQAGPRASFQTLPPTLTASLTVLPQNTPGQFSVHVDNPDAQDVQLSVENQGYPFTTVDHVTTGDYVAATDVAGWSFYIQLILPNGERSAYQTVTVDTPPDTYDAILTRNGFNRAGEEVGITHSPITGTVPDRFDVYAGADVAQGVLIGDISPDEVLIMAVTGNTNVWLVAIVNGQAAYHGTLAQVYPSVFKNTALPIDKVVDPFAPGITGVTVSGSDISYTLTTPADQTRTLPAESNVYVYLHDVANGADTSNDQRFDFRSQFTSLSGPQTITNVATGSYTLRAERLNHIFAPISTTVPVAVTV